MRIKTMIVSAFEDRRAGVTASLHNEGALPIRDTKVEIVPAPLGRDVPPTELSPHPHWRDTVNPKLLTYGELGCLRGHMLAWEKASQMGIPSMIFEDDARAVRAIPVDTIARYLEVDEPRLVYLGYKRMGDWPGDPGPEGVPLRIAPRCWWTVGYAINPQAAHILLELVKDMDNLAIPADEVLPLAYGASVTENRLGLIGEGVPKTRLVGATCLNEPCVEPGGAESTTDNPDYAFDLKAVVFATERAKATKTIASLEANGFDVVVLGEGQPHWDTSGEGGRQKLEWLAKWCEEHVDKNWIVLAMDGYDTLMRSSPADILKRYGQMRHPLVVSGETRHWPPRPFDKVNVAPVNPEKYPEPPKLPGQGIQQAFDALDLYEDDENPRYRYPCSGLFMGDVATLWETLDAALKRMPHEKDDQAVIQFDVLSRPDVWRIDREAYLFQSLGGDNDAIGKRDGRNRHTGTWPVVLHANGPEANLPNEHRNWAPDRQRIEDAPIEIADGVMMVRVMPADVAHRLAALLDAQEGWKSLRGDNVPGDELRIREVETLLDDAGFTWAGAGDETYGLEDRIERMLAPVCEDRWYPPVGWMGVKDLFAIRYSTHLQPNLRLHTDISRFSASIVLRRAGAGGELYLPRQNFTDRLVEPGVALVWPSRVTHPHMVTNVEAGQRISLVVWTKDSDD